MSPLTLFFTVALTHLLVVVSPGPDFAMVTRQTLAHGRRAGLWTALGIGSGITFHVAWAMFGMGWVIVRFPSLLDVLRDCGALLLIVMGGKAIRAKPATTRPLDMPGTVSDGAHHYGIGVLTNVLNPKALLYFMALCSTVITGATPAWLRIALGLWMVLFTAAWFCLVSFTLGHAQVRQRLTASAHWIDRGMGVLLLTLGAITILSGLGR